MDFGCPWLGVFGSDGAQLSNFGIRWFLVGQMLPPKSGWRVGVPLDG